MIIIKKIIPIIILIIIVIILIVFLIKGKKEYHFKIHFFNAGKADAMIISNNDKYIMIDTAEESFSDEILDYLKENNITKIDFLIITHFDKDHVGGASNIINSIEVSNVLQSNYPKDSVYYNNYIESLNNKNIAPITIENDYSFDLEDMKITINGPQKIYDKNESNNSSLITKIYYKNNSFLFMGDTQNARIKDFISSNEETFDFIKIPYHGRHLKQLDNLIVNTNPEYAVITSSTDTDNDETLNTLKKHNIKTYLTRDNDINVYSDGDNITIKQ